MYWYSENIRVLSSHPKLSAVPIQAETVSRHSEVMTPGRTKMWPHQRLECSPSNNNVTNVFSYKLKEFRKWTKH